MMLGQNECDWETAYFLEHGVHYPIPENNKRLEPELDYDDYLERQERYMEQLENDFFASTYEKTYKYALWY